MRAALALLASREIQNTVRKIVFDFDRQYNLPFMVSLLPAHVSLKQPFGFEEMTSLENYFDSLAASIPPFDILLDRFYYFSGNGYGLLGLNVIETPLLRGLHDRLNRELVQVVTDPQADFDGEGYRFHLSITGGQVEGQDAYRAYYEALPVKKVDLSFTARELALFYYADRQPGPGSFTVYKIQALDG